MITMIMLILLIIIIIINVMRGGSRIFTFPPPLFFWGGGECLCARTHITSAKPEVPSGGHFIKRFVSVFH